MFHHIHAGETAHPLLHLSAYLVTQMGQGVSWAQQEGAPCHLELLLLILKLPPKTPKGGQRKRGQELVLMMQQHQMMHLSHIPMAHHHLVSFRPPFFAQLVKV
jgi:hypothetical protein